MRNNNSILIPASFYEHVELFAERLKQDKESLAHILQEYETYETAIDEIDRSISTLLGLQREHIDIKNPRTDLLISTFFPLNLPIYSLVLFGIAPSCFAKNIFIRPPKVMEEILEKIVALLQLDLLFPNISLHPTQRHTFLELYASVSDVILFTGKYENAIAISNKCPDALMLYNGSGVNPFVLFNNANITLSAQKAVEMRCFNSGQDCAGPDAFIMPKPFFSAFQTALLKELKDIKTGDSKDKSNRISSIIKKSYIDEIKAWLATEQRHLLYGGTIEYEKCLVFPTIVAKPAHEHTEDDFHEFFAPVFYILYYDSEDELLALLKSPAFTQRAMYVSVFGDNLIAEKEILKHARILRNTIVNDVEIGNTEYGGYGQKSNFVKFGSTIKPGPILISRELNTYLFDNKSHQ